MGLLGRGLALLGAAALGVSLWEPWYRVQIPADIRGQIDGSIVGAGPLAGFLRQGFEALTGSLTVTGWQALHGVDVVLLIIAVLAGLAALLGLAGRPVMEDGDDGVGFALAGLLAVGLVAYRMIDRPEPTQLMGLGFGIHLALGGASAIVVGGLLARRQVPRRRPSTAPVTTGFPPSGHPTPTGRGSVPPPGF